ncbi:MAG: outer membrane beta-barrel family protein [Muribaculaceae bacterium]|nr:outer membrane beta-barrel family protein [Muribaculaceae bacterium]
MKKLFLMTLIGLVSNSLSAQKETSDSIVALKEVVVSTTLPQVKNIGSVSVVRVRGTILSKMGNASSVLENTPGLHKGASGIEVNGLGKPVFIMNEHEINPDKVLDMLQANTIKEIRIDRNPDINYSATGRPVVEIVPYKPLDDYLTLSVGDDMAIRCKYSNAANVNVGGQFGKITTTLNYMGGVARFQNRETYFRDIYHDSYTSVFNQRRTDDNKDLPHRVRWALDYMVSKKHRLGVEYYYQHNTREQRMTGIDYYSGLDNTSENDYVYSDDRLANLHNISAQYNYKSGKKSFQIIQDYGYNTSRGSVNSQEGFNLLPIGSYSGSKYNTATTSVKFGTQLPMKISIISGLKYNYVNNHTTSRYESLPSDISGYASTSSVTEYNPQAYVSFSRKIARFTLNAGVRYQFVHRQIVNGLSGGGKRTYNQNLSSFFPLVSLKYSGSNGTSFFVRYNRSIEQPGFASLNSGLVYNDSLTYSIGNPDVKSALTDALSGEINWRNFSFSALYSHTSNPIVNDSEQNLTESNVVINRDINFKSSNSLRVALSYSKTILRFNLYVEGAVVVPHGKYIFRGNEVKADRVSFNGNLKASYMIKSFLGVFTSFDYLGYNTYLTCAQKPVNNLTVGLVASFLKNRLQINVAFSDLLNGANYNNMTFRYKNVVNGTYGSNDQRGLMIKLSYAIFTKKINTRASRSNDDTISRIL